MSEANQWTGAVYLINLKRLINTLVMLLSLHERRLWAI